MSDCTEPDRAGCPRLCADFCNKAETRKANDSCLAAGSPSREFVALQNPKTKRWVYCSPFHTTDYTPLERRPDAVLCRVNCEAIGETFDASGAIVRPDTMDHFNTLAAARAQFQKENDERNNRGSADE